MWLILKKKQSTKFDNFSKDKILLGRHQTITTGNFTKTSTITDYCWIHVASCRKLSPVSQNLLAPKNAVAFKVKTSLFLCW